jgi:PAS domain S-box-containing protein
LEDKDLHIAHLLQENEALKSKLFDATNIIDAIKEGEIDALVVHADGVPQIYSIESADYTYRILIEKFSEGALSITHDGLILYSNDYFSQLTGISSEDITGTNIDAYFEDPEEFHTLITNLDASNSTVKKDIVLSVKGNKTPVTIAFTDLNPTVEAIGVVVTDLTEKKENEQALLNYQQQLEEKVNELNITNVNLGQFIHVISHDLKEPLRKIIMCASLLPTENTEGKSNPVAIIKASAQRLNSLVDDLVKYSFSSVKDDVIDIDLNDILKEVTEDLEVAINENVAVVHYTKLPSITGTRVQMRQLFSNLISNAIKYSKTNVIPQIDIDYDIVTEHDATYYKVSVKDNGIGMDNAHLDKIFTIFQRLHLRNEYSGNGIGLAICKKIMENHSGRIDVESTPNMGSTFNLYFPVFL